jgi:hypothetical protein
MLAQQGIDAWGIRPIHGPRWRPHSRQRNIELAITWTPEPSARDDLDIEILFDGRHILMGFLVGGQLPLNQL